MCPWLKNWKCKRGKNKARLTNLIVCVVSHSRIDRAIWGISITLCHVSQAQIRTTCFFCAGEQVIVGFQREGSVNELLLFWLSVSSQSDLPIYRGE